MCLKHLIQSACFLYACTANCYAANITLGGVIKHKTAFNCKVYHKFKNSHVFQSIRSI